MPLPTGSLDPQHGKYTQEIWDKQTLGNTKGFLDASRVTWGAQSPYDASKYGLVPDNASEASFRNEPTYIPQGYTRPVSKYIDANGVEHRVIRRSFSPNRKSFTEGLLLKDETAMSSVGGFRTVLNQKNLHHNYSSPALAHVRNVGNYTDGDESALQPGIIKRNYMTKSMEYLGNGKSPAVGNDQWKDIGDGHMFKKSPKDNLRHWQQQHQEELLHQHLETQVGVQFSILLPYPHLMDLLVSFSFFYSSSSSFTSPLSSYSSSSTHPPSLPPLSPPRLLHSLFSSLSPNGAYTCNHLTFCLLYILLFPFITLFSLILFL